MAATPLLSVIMPCYNVADTICRAIDSVLMQTVDFSYEIILVDDASTDDSPEIFCRYADKHSFIKVIRNSSNSGNAISFYNGLCEAKGKYFCVLDGDDYYSVGDKLQRQIDFLEADLKGEYVAACHHYVFGVNDQVYVPAVGSRTEFNYVDFITQNSGYYHTATFMYRNIFRGRVLEYYKEQVLRGDSPRTMFHLMYSNKKVKILNFVGSVYVYTYTGIWSGLDTAKQNERHIRLYSRLAEVADTDFERKQFRKMLDAAKDNEEKGTGELRSFHAHTVGEYMNEIQNLAKIYGNRSAGMNRKGIYHSEYLDSMIETLGYMYRILFPEYVQKKTDSRTISIVAGSIGEEDAEVANEICDLIRMYPQHRVEIILTDMTSCEGVLCELKDRDSVHIHCVPERCTDRMAFLSGKLVEISPYKAYFYIRKDTPYVSALIQRGLCKNICVFSYDYGYLCGISNSGIDCFIAKRPSDYQMLEKYFPNRVRYIPGWSRRASEAEQYEPFRGHEALITACAAAEFCNAEGMQDCSYVDMICDVLEKTRGTHYHFGPIPEATKALIVRKLKEKGCEGTEFIHIPQLEGLAEKMLNNHVDIFIEPFSVLSNRLTLEVQSAGIPVFAFDGFTRMTTLDFSYKENLRWRNRTEFVQVLQSLNRVILLEHGQKTKEYFNENHDAEIIAPYLVNERQFCAPGDVVIADDVIHEIAEFSRVYGMTPQINFAFPTRKSAGGVSKSDVKKVEQPSEAMRMREETMFQKLMRVCREEGVRAAFLKGVGKIRKKLRRP